MASLDLVQHRGDGSTTRGERDIDADTFEQPSIVGPADSSNDARHAELPTEERRQQVFLVVVDHRDQHVALANIFALQEREIRPVALQDQGALQPRSEQLATSRVALDHSQLDTALSIKALGQAEPDVATADDRDRLMSALCTRYDAPLDFGHLRCRAHDDDLVADGQRRLASRYEERLTTPHRDNQ